MGMVIVEGQRAVLGVNVMHPIVTMGISLRIVARPPTAMRSSQITFGGLVLISAHTAAVSVWACVRVCVMMACGTVNAKWVVLVSGITLSHRTSTLY